MNDTSFIHYIPLQHTLQGQSTQEFTTWLGSIASHDS